MSHATSNASSSLINFQFPILAETAEAPLEPKASPRGIVAATLLISPTKVKSPMKYHYYEELPEVSKRELRGFRGKAQHSIAPDSSKKQVKVIQRNYSQIRKLSKLCFEDADVSLMTLRDEEDAAEIVVRSQMEIEVSQNGRKRVFGVHETVTKEQKKQCRLYPKEGTGIIRLGGPEVLSLIDDYKQQKAKVSFQAFVVASVRDEDGDCPTTRSSDSRKQEGK